MQDKTIPTVAPQSLLDAENLAWARERFTCHVCEQPMYFGSVMTPRGRYQMHLKCYDTKGESDND
jgi:hypothetical protein